MKLRPKPAPPPLSEMPVVQRRIDSLIPDPQNAREHSRTQLRMLGKAITAFGIITPILIDHELNIISGEARAKAAEASGFDVVPTVLVDHLSPAQILQFKIADNQIATLATWNDPKFALSLKTLSEIETNFDFELVGLTIPEADIRIQSLTIASVDRPDPDDAAVAPGPAVCKLGQIWRLGRHLIICGSSLEPETFVELLGQERVAACFSDPPYNVPIHGFVSGKGKRRHREFGCAVGDMSDPVFIAFLMKALARAAEFSADGSVHYWCMDWRHIDALLAAGRATYDELLNLCVWIKNNGGMGSLYRSSHELIPVFRKGSKAHRNNVQLGKFGRNRTNTWSYPGANTFLRSAEDADLMAQHPTPKPVQMVADALLDVTARNDLVLDSFLGSGATLMACERIGRQCRGIELDPLYIDLAIRRWQRLTGDDAILESTGQTFNALEAEAA